MRLKTIYYSLKVCLKSPLILPIYLIYKLSNQKRTVINEDIAAIISFDKGILPKSYDWSFFKLFALGKCFRNQVYHRLKPWSFIFRTLPQESTLTINIPEGCLGGGLHIHHGHSTRITARKIGKNFTVHHNCTIAHGKGGTPIIGDNVFVGTGVVIIGAIKIGDNVNIGANATIFKDVPSNCTIVGPSPTIVRINGQKVHESL